MVLLPRVGGPSGADGTLVERYEAIAELEGGTRQSSRRVEVWCRLGPSTKYNKMGQSLIVEKEKPAVAGPSYVEPQVNGRAQAMSEKAGSHVANG